MLSPIDPAAYVSACLQSAPVGNLMDLLALYGPDLAALTVWRVEQGYQANLSTDKVAWTVNKNVSIEAALLGCLIQRFGG